MKCPIRSIRILPLLMLLLMPSNVVHASADCEPVIPAKTKCLCSFSRQSILTSNSYLHRQGSSSNATIGGRAAMVSVLRGRKRGINEIVTIHVTLLSNSRLFYAIMVVLEADSEVYRDTFKRVVGSIQFN